MSAPIPPSSKASFAAVVDADTRLLLLGSLPGDASLRHAQYYAHPRNAFWRLLEAVTDRALVALPYPERLAALAAAGIGLWDVIQSAERPGSLDAAIRRAVPNPLDALVATLPALQAIGFNGATAAAIGRRQLGPAPGPALVALPSSSPAHAIPFAVKQAGWLALRRFVILPG